MRTKTTILSAVALAAGLLSASAQVYSANVVGYVNVVIPVNYSVISNPFTNSDMSVSNLFKAAVDSGAAQGCVVYTWDGSGLVADANDTFDATWQNPALQLPPGVGFFFQNLTGVPITNTFVGQVPQGALTKTVNQNYTVPAALTPVAGFLQTDLSFTNAAPGDVVYLWDGAGLVACAKDFFDSTWQPLAPPFSSDPVKGPFIKVGQGFFYQNNSGGNLTWLKNFTVQ